MLKPEELKNKNFKVFLGMPMYGGMLAEATMHGLLDLQQWCMRVGVGLRFQSMGNESLITRARNTIVSMMMDQTDFAATHLLFIDADICFTSQNIERLLCAEKDVACGVYPRKHLHLEKLKDIFNDNPDATPDEIEAKCLGYNINFDDLFDWITSYCEDLPFHHKGLLGWVVKFCVLRRKALNGGYYGRPRKDY